jgi:hypothetical protein
MSKRISFSALDAAHIYEWLVMYWRQESQKFGGCPQCADMGQRLEQFIGPTTTRRVRRIVKAYPGEK